MKEIRLDIHYSINLSQFINMPGNQISIIKECLTFPFCPLITTLLSANITAFSIVLQNEWDLRALWRAMGSQVSPAINMAHDPSVAQFSQWLRNTISIWSLIIWTPGTCLSPPQKMQLSVVLKKPVLSKTLKVIGLKSILT